MNAKWVSHVVALKEELKASKLREETLELSRGQLARELTMAHMKEQANRVELFALMLHSASLHKAIEDLTAQRSQEESSRRAQKESCVKEWEESFWVSLEINDKFIDCDFAFLQWGFEDCTYQF